MLLLRQLFQFLYPNPVNNQLFISGLSGYQTLQLRDMNGKTMIQTNIVAAQQVIDA